MSLPCHCRLSRSAERIARSHCGAQWQQSARDRLSPRLRSSSSGIAEWLVATPGAAGRQARPRPACAATRRGSPHPRRPDRRSGARHIDHRAARSPRLLDQRCLHPVPRRALRRRSQLGSAADHGTHKDFLNPRKNAWFGHGSVEVFLARRNGEVVGRVALKEGLVHTRPLVLLRRGVAGAPISLAGEGDCGGTDRRGGPRLWRATPGRSFEWGANALESGEVRASGGMSATRRLTRRSSTSGTGQAAGRSGSCSAMSLLTRASSIRAVSRCDSCMSRTVLARLKVEATV